LSQVVLLLLTPDFRGRQAPAQCNIGEYSPLPQQESCLPCPGSAAVGASVCPGRRRALLAADGSFEGAEVSVADAPNGDVIGMMPAAGFAACTLGVLGLMGMAARRRTIVQGLKQSSAVGPATDAAAAAAVALDATGGRC
jgi:hypothetical protein